MAQAAPHIDQAMVNQFIALLLRWLIQLFSYNTGLGYGRDIVIFHRELNGFSDPFSTNAGLPNHCNNLSVGAASWPRFAPGGRRSYSLMQDLTIGEFQR